MYKILLVDDEKMELQALTDCVPWSDMDIRVVGTAKNGREALELTQQLLPDIILTDVRMPIMDGLEFARRAKGLHKQISIVFLSGHDEFQYIKSALAVEATGYLLKPVDLDELAQLMEKVKLKCQEARLAARSESLAKEKLLRELLLEESEQGRAQLARQLAELDRRLPLRWRYAAVYMQTAGASPSELAAPSTGPDVLGPLERSVRVSIRSQLQAMGFAGELIDWGYGAFVALLPASLLDGDPEPLRQLQKTIGEEFPLALTIGLSRPGERLEDAGELVKEARSASGQSFYYGSGALLSAEELRGTVMGEVEIGGSLETLRRLIGLMLPDEAELEIKRFTADLRERHIHPQLARSAAVRLVTAVEQHFAGAFKEQHRPFNSEWIIMNDCTTLEEIEAHILHVCSTLAMALADKDKDRHQHVARHVQEIIDRSYSTSLTVEEIAKEVYLSPNYIRSIFKDKTGKTILEAITDRRMERASMLLSDKSLKIHEVAGRVGYENVSYFCSVFQRTTGMTPNHYRKQI